MPDAKLLDRLERSLLDGGAILVACGDLGPVPVDVREGLPRGVCIGVALNPAVVAGIGNGPTRAYQAEYDRARRLLDGLAEECAALLQSYGHQAVPCKSTVGTLDKGTLATDLPHKTVATRAGVGWVGKCALLITKGYGSAIRFNTVLTDAPLPVGPPVEESRCAKCNACVEACPAGAPTGRNWRAGMEREELLDAFGCYECILKLARNAEIDRVICGICIAACPHTQKYVAGAGVGAGE